MAEIKFNIRLQNKYDTYANWVANNPVLKAGEVAIVEVPASTGAVAQEPMILYKVGDGTSAFNDLPFGGARAADVHDWAKASAKPTYTAQEISGLSEYISGEIEDTDTQYKIEQDATDQHILSLYSKAKDATTWTKVTSVTTPDTVYDDTAVRGLIQTNANAIAVLNGTGTGSVSKQVADAVAALVADAPEAYDTLKEISDWITSHSSDAAGMNSRITANAADIDALENLIGALPEGAASTTIVAYITETVNAMGAGKVDKVTGKGLSTNDYTTAEKNKLAGVAAGAQVNVIETVKVNGTALTPDANRAVDVAVPTGALASKDKVAESDLSFTLAAIAKSGNIADLKQSAGDVIIFDCGTSSTVI